MKRRNYLKYLGIGTGAVLLNPVKAAAKEESATKKKRLMRVAHITDVHIRPEHDASNRFLKCLEEIKKHKVDFFLNGGDTIYAADYSNITRDRVNAQWEIWHKLRKEFSEFEVYSCLGNHDMWWATEESDVMYGKDYVVDNLDIPNNYYSLKKSGWTFIVLDSLYKRGIALGDEQMAWLDDELASLPTDSPVLIMTHCPILNVSTIIDGGNHKDFEEITDLFYKHKDKKINCISGHVHLLDKSNYNGVDYYSNGAMSGFWWEEGNERSGGKSWVRETPPGYAILDLYDDGTMDNTYYPHTY
ncbi:metallophosphoesterase family protein [Portibacter lacus]|uniref:Calcineurin-like phosphoesterase domain-containing protein n=1 Tax=Portibacter lacus TaxID=1099794 RepID=A0AA37SST3_9BACT|nr:metallophosphoesterase [Portibacter lacus]GLR17538.1 hypothetical protein GCM10007940_21530 [Portibacter lacus]